MSRFIKLQADCFKQPPVIYKLKIFGIINKNRAEIRCTVVVFADFLKIFVI